MFLKNTLYRNIRHRIFHLYEMDKTELLRPCDIIKASL